MNTFSFSRKFCSLLWGVMLAFLAASSSVAVEQEGAAPEQANSIESVDYTALPGGKIVVKVGLKQPLPNQPASFTINNPARLALDFPNTGNALGKNSISVGEGVLRGMNIVQSGGRTRLVMNLAKPVGYETSIEGNNLLITLQSAEAAAVSSSNVAARFAEAVPGAEQHELVNVDFHRGKNGEGRVLVDLSDTATGIDIRMQGKNIVVDFLNTTLPRSLERRLNVLDFGTPVQNIETYVQGNNVRMVIEPKGLWEHSAYQADRQFVVEVKPIIEDPNKLVQGTKPGYAGEKMSLQVRDANVRDLLREVFGDFTGLSIVVSDTVTGNLTLNLKDVPWDQALDVILNVKGLDKRKSGNVIWIAPRDELAAKEKMELEAKKQLSELEPLQTEYYPLNYLRADQAKNILTGAAGVSADGGGEAKCETKPVGISQPAMAGGGGGAAGAAGGAPGAPGAGSGGVQQILSKRGSASFELKTNMLIVNDIPSKHEEIRKLLSVLDVPSKQVVIEARIVLADDKFSKQLGARFGVQAKRAPGGYTTGVAGSLEGSSGIAGGTAISGSSFLNVSLPAAGSVVTGTPGALALTMINLGSNTLINLELSALEADQRGKIVSNPRVMTSNQRPAVIMQGVEIPVVTPGTSTSPPSVSFKPALLCLLVNPQVLNNDTIVLDVEVTKDTKGDEISSSGLTNFAIDTRRIKTQVLINNGDTAVLGGIFEQETHNDVSKVPLFGDIPVVGALFRHTTKKDDRKELLIFITPKILKENLSIR